MRQVAAQADPDQPARLVTLPASWDDGAAEALAALVPGTGAVNIAAASSVWVGLLATRARQAGQTDAIAASLLLLLQRRQVAGNAAIWNEAFGAAGAPGFRINAAGFHQTGGGYDVAAFAQAAGLAARACRLLSPAAPQYEIGLTGLDDLLACAGLAYDSRAARDVGACLAALLRASVELALQGDQRDLLATGADWPAPPGRCVLPGLAEAAMSARLDIARAPGVVPAAGIFPPGPADALLGVETGGIAPAFSPVRDQHLTRAAQDRLAAAAMSPEAALAAVLVGDVPLPVAGRAAHEAMHSAVAAYLTTMPALPARLPAPEASSDRLVGVSATRAARHEALPSRHAGLTQKVSLGGHRLFLRTAEYPDGRLGEISLTLPRESASVRCLAECFAQAVSLGLQHGTPLDAFVEAFILTRFGPSGVVDGDPEVDRATSVADYVVRTLSATYLGRILPPAPCEDEPTVPKPGATPLLPLELPARRRAMRLVA